MARLYRVSADTSEKEKIIGGILTLYQGGWILLGLLLDVGLFLPLASALPPLVALLLAAPPGILLGWLFAFCRRGDLSFAAYLYWRRRFRRRHPRLVNTLTCGKDFRGQPSLF